MSKHSFNPNGFRIYQNEIEDLSNYYQVSTDRLKKNIKKHISPVVIDVANYSKGSSIRDKDVFRVLKKKYNLDSKQYGGFDTQDTNGFCDNHPSQCVDSINNSCQIGGTSIDDYCAGEPSQCDDYPSVCGMSSKKNKYKKNNKHQKVQKGHDLTSLIKRSIRHLEKAGIISKKRLTQQAGGALSQYLLYKMDQDFH